MDSKTDSGFHILDSIFRIPGTEFQSLSLDLDSEFHSLVGFWIP